MPVTDAYATAAEYRTRVTKTDAGDDSEIDEQLTGVSRFLGSRMRRFFTQDASAVARIYDGNGKAKLWLPDDVATTTDLVIKVDMDGDYDFSDETALDLNTDFWIGPYNADKGPEPRPYEWLLVHPNSTVLSSWTEQDRFIQVTAKFGWPAVPAAIKEITVAITRQLRDLQEAGATQALQDIDAVIQQSPQLAALMLRIERQYMKPPRF